MPVPETIILINTVSPTPLIAAGGDEPVVLQQRGLAETLVPMVQGMMMQYPRSMFRIVRGPGSFTGIRIGLAVGLALRLSGYSVQGVNAFDALRACWLRTHGTPMPDDQTMMLPFYKDHVFLTRGGEGEDALTITNTPPASCFQGPALPTDYHHAPAAPLTPLYGRASYVGV